jgi:hypothetical protein
MPFLRDISQIPWYKHVYFSILVLLLLKPAPAGDIIVFAKNWGSFHSCERPDKTCRHWYFCRDHSMPKWLEKCSIALLQICYIFFTLGMDMLTGKNAGDIINLNSEGQSLPLLMKVVRQAGLSQRGEA